METIRPGKTSAILTAPNLAFSRLAVFLLSFSFVGCSTAEKPKTETAPTVLAQTEEVQPAAIVSRPDLEEVKEVVKRVFRDSVEIDSGRKPVFIHGDFNGDGSQDLATVIKPAPNKLSDLNEEFPSWILRDPLLRDEPRIPRLRIAANETLLAVIHGYGAKGWRDAQATQTFLLKNAVGSGMTTHQREDLTGKNKTQETPHLRGDVIGQVVDGSTGYLYFSGATYSWYDPKTFQEEADTGRAHMRANKKRK